MIQLQTLLQIVILFNKKISGTIENKNVSHP